MDHERSKQIADSIHKKGGDRPCPRCGHNKFDLLAETRIPIQEDPRWTSVFQPVVPTVLIACSNCGFISQHALGPLGVDTEAVNA